LASEDIALFAVAKKSADHRARRLTLQAMKALAGRELDVVSKKVVHTLPRCEAIDAGVRSGGIVAVGPWADGCGSVG
jgi:hypothetical protein